MSAAMNWLGTVGESASSSESANRLLKPPVDRVGGAASSSSESLNRDRKPDVNDLPDGAVAAAGFDDLKLDTLNLLGLLESLARALLFLPRMVGVSSMEPFRRDWRMPLRLADAGGEEDLILHREEADAPTGEVGRRSLAESTELARMERRMLYLPIESIVETEGRLFFLKLDSESESSVCIFGKL